LCGEPDKPEVKKHIEELDSAWDNITALYAKREENLIDAMEKAMEYHDTLNVKSNFFQISPYMKNHCFSFLLILLEPN
jgi:dystonin